MFSALLDQRLQAAQRQTQQQLQQIQQEPADNGSSGGFNPLAGLQSEQDDQNDTKAKPEKKARTTKVAKPKEFSKLTTKQIEKAIEEEDPAKKQQLVMLIQRFLIDDRFGNYLKQLGFAQTIAQLNKKTIQSLEHELAKIKIAVSNKNSGAFIDKAALGALKAAEPLISRYYNIAGLAATLENDDEFLDTMRELALERATIAYVKPELRIAMKVGYTALGVNAVHRQMAKLKPQERQQFAEQIVQQQKQQQQQQPHYSSPIVEIDQDQVMQLDPAMAESVGVTQDTVEPVLSAEPQPIAEKVVEKKVRKLPSGKPKPPAKPKAPASAAAKKPKVKKAAVKSEPAAKKPRTTRAKKSTNAAASDEPDPTADPANESADSVEPAESSNAQQNHILITRERAEQLSQLDPESRELNMQFEQSADNIELPDGFLP